MNAARHPRVSGRSAVEIENELEVGAGLRNPPQASLRFWLR